MQTFVQTENYAGLCVHREIFKGPTVVLLPSYLWSAQSMWAPQIEWLGSKGFSIVAIDYPCHGEANIASPEACTLESIQASLKKVFDHFDIEHAMILGLSVGGMVGARFAIANPERVTGLAMMATCVTEESPEKQALYFALIDQIEAEGFSDALLDKVTPFFFTQKTLKANLPFVKAFWKSLSQIKNPDQLRGIAALGKSIFTRKDISEAFSKLPCEVSVYVGAEDIARPVPESEFMRDCLLTAEPDRKDVLTIIPGASHIMTLEQPDLLNQSLGEFLG